MPNTVLAAAEGLPAINRRKALTVTGSGLIAALTGLAASTMKAPAVPIKDEAELATIRRLARELSIAMNAWSGTVGEGWHVAIWPASERQHPVSFVQDGATERARAEAEANTPVMVLFRKWSGLYKRAGQEGVAEADVDALLAKANRIERKLIAMPIDTAAEYAAKVLAATGYGDYGFGDYEARLLADARQLVGEA